MFAVVYFEFACSESHEIFTEYDQCASCSIPIFGGRVGVGWGPFRCHTMCLHEGSLSSKVGNGGPLPGFWGSNFPNFRIFSMSKVKLL